MRFFLERTRAAQGIEYALPLPAALRMRRKIRPVLFRILYPLQIYWNRKPRRAKIGGLALRTDPRVFHPGLHFSSKILANHVAGLDLNGCKVLDMGTGSGVIGVIAALQGAQVAAADINPEAAKLAAGNAFDHGVSANVRVMCSDLFSALANAPAFDWIIFNPPFFPHAAQQGLEIAFNAGNDYETVQRFLQQAKFFLAPAGKILLILSSDMDLAQVRSMIERFQYQIVRSEIKPHLFEMFYLVHLTAISKQ
jgi:release factor glutamine methyltransferase